MHNLLMISGYGATNLHAKGAFYNMLEEFHKHWERIDIICPRGRKSEGEKIKSYFDNVFVHESPWPIMLQPLFIRRQGAFLHRQIGFDLVTVHEYPPFYNGLGAYGLAGVIGVPFVLEIHHIPGYPRAATLREALYRKLTQRLIRYELSYARAVRTVNRYEAPAFLQSAGVPAEKIRFISSLYIDTALFRPSEADKKYDCIFVGRLAANKGIDLFLDAVKAARVRTLVVGDGPLKRHVQARIELEGLDGQVHLYGWARDAQEIALLMNQSRLLVMTSYNEGGPRVVLEALACGVPVIATPVGAVPDVIENGGTGLLVGWDAREIGAAITALLQDAARYARMSAAGSRIAERFERSAAIARYARKLKDFI